MKKIPALLILIIFSMKVLGQTEPETIKNANNLITDKKYESAFKLLDNYDPKNEKPDIVLLKVEIALNYFVTSIMHKVFAFKNLEMNEDIMDYRGKEGSFGMQAFAIDEVLDNLIKIYPKNCKLYKGLGDYYYEVHLKYGDKWLKNNNELFKLIQLNDKKAIDGNCADYLTYYAMGYIAISQKGYKDGIPYFLKSIEMNKNYASSNYNIAYAYLFTNDRENALKYAKQSEELYTDITYKSDAARMVGQIYIELKDDNNALTYYEMANKIDTGNYYNIKPLLNLYVRTESEKINVTRKKFFDLAPTNPTIYNDLEDIFYNNKKESDLTAFYKEQLLVFNDNAKVQGNLNFYLGKIYIGIDKKLAKEYFLDAKEIFNKIYSKDHQVFKAIEDGIKQTEK